MPHRFLQSLLVPSRLAVASLALGAVALLGCSDSTGSSGGGGGSTTWSGTIADAAGSGALNLVFDAAVKAPPFSSSGAALASQPPINGTGTIKRSGVADAILSVVVNGTTVTFTGGGYDGTGTIGSGKSHGTLTGPNGAGAFNAVPATTANPATSFCGTFTGTTGVAQGDAGQWTVTIAGTAVSGTAFSNSGDVIPLDGTASGKNVTVGATSVDGSATATGTINSAGDQISGTYTLKDPSGTAVGGGTWGGVTCGS